MTGTSPNLHAPEGQYPPDETLLHAPVDPTWAKASANRLRAVWAKPRGFRYWSAVNNSEVGQWYAMLCFGFMLGAGVLALLVRIQLSVPENDFMSADRFNQLFTMHGSAMMFLFAVPMFEAIAILLLPGFLGARDMPFPRLSAYGFWCFAIGGTFVFGSVLFGVGPDSGWFMYPPLATKSEGIGADIWLLGLSFIEVSSIAAAVELIVGVLKCRAPGMRINLMPLYAWYVLVVGVMILFAFPPLIAGDFLFELERSFDWPFFDPERGGDPMLWQHLFWIFGHPEVYIIFLPSIAIAAMVIPTAAQRPIVGYSWIVLSAVAVGFLSFGLWVHHMFTTGLPAISLGFFSAASEAVVIPTGVQLFAFLATLMVGRIKMSVPMLYTAGALAIFTCGGLTGIMVALVPFDRQVHDTYFIVAHLHYTLFGGMVFPVMAGVYYFYPVIRKKLMSPTLGKWAFWLTFTGFNVCFLPMHFTGLQGMPRRVYTYPDMDALNWGWLNMISTVGAFVMAAGFLVFLWDVIRKKGPSENTPRNPWEAGTLEWSHDAPKDPGWGLRSIPFITSRYPLWQQPGLVDRMDAGRYYLGDAPEGERETLITSVLDARPLLCQRVSGPAWITLIAAGFTGGLFILPVFKIYWLALICGGGALAAIVLWLWRDTGQIPDEPMKDVGLGLRLPVYASGPTSVGWWGVFITMLGDMTALASLVFGFFFYWTAGNDFPLPGAEQAHGGLSLLAAVSYGLAWAAMMTARWMNRAQNVNMARCALMLAPVLTLIGAGAVIGAVWVPDLAPTSHVYPAMLWAFAIWTVVHTLPGLIMPLYCLAGSYRGKLTPTHDADLWNSTLYWHFLLVTALVATTLVGLLPRIMV